MARTKRKEAKIRPAALGKTRPCVQYPIKIKNIIILTIKKKIKILEEAILSKFWKSPG